MKIATDSPCRDGYELTILYFLITTVVFAFQLLPHELLCQLVQQAMNSSKTDSNSPGNMKSGPNVE
jgi:hypothetical protein